VREAMSALSERSLLFEYVALRHDAARLRCRRYDIFITARYDELPLMLMRRRRHSDADDGSGVFIR